ncbi:PH domain-containing protein [Streptomyces sp. SL13]|uniref:PH domain-containing protein n=1 Tax=Streptantibioticus silvisoli TaxID=2705255 RepID=A0AA90H9Y7_9ACTN|nr:PH domain-containing protein [Streptantibioticus silvisoli]MDI5965345.1 PH domain-containing protein [Streptantibioticus silvisoli]MDI5972872.1 PH domain-containing protein [Streptantibioticus silvisoli]
MSLPHATANRRPAGADDPVRRLGRRWRRPYPLGPFRVGPAACLLVLVTYLLVAAFVDRLAGDSSATVSLLVGAVLLTAVALRMLRVGVWVSGDGLRTVRLLRTSTLPWDRVASVRTVQQPVRWLYLPRTVQGQALVVRRTDGAVLPVLLTDRCPDFLGRPERFDRAADAVEGWARLLRRG